MGTCQSHTFQMVGTFDRPGVAGAVLQTALLISNLNSQSLTFIIFLK